MLVNTACWHAHTHTHPIKTRSTARTDYSHTAAWILVLSFTFTQKKSTAWLQTSEGVAVFFKCWLLLHVIRRAELQFSVPVKLVQERVSIWCKDHSLKKDYVCLIFQGSQHAASLASASVGIVCFYYWKCVLVYLCGCTLYPGFARIPSLQHNPASVTRSKSNGFLGFFLILHACHMWAARTLSANV